MQGFFNVPLGLHLPRDNPIHEYLNRVLCYVYFSAPLTVIVCLSLLSHYVAACPSNTTHPINHSHLALFTEVSLFIMVSLLYSSM